MRVIFINLILTNKKNKNGNSTFYQNKFLRLCKVGELLK